MLKNRYSYSAAIICYDVLLGISTNEVWAWGCIVAYLYTAFEGTSLPIPQHCMVLQASSFVGPTGAPSTQLVGFVQAFGLGPRVSAACKLSSRKRDA